MGKIIMNGNTYGSVGSDVEANPQGTATDTLNTIGIDNVIYEIQGGGGGGGNVDDVYVNGASVLDSSHIAQITSYKEVTKAQYDAIPNKDNDNILYCIIDEGEVIGDNFNPIIYSTSEREVGTWIDGKPLYQRTIDYGVNKNIEANTWTDIGIPKGDIESIVLTQVTNNEGTNYSYAGTAININNNINMISMRATSYRYITLQYTKTTDVPGAAQYTSFGVPAVHYSTDEQVIGTWIDGKPVYQKTIVLPSEITVSNTDWTSTGITASNLDIETYVRCSAQNSSGTCWDAINVATIDSNISLTAWRNGDTIAVKIFTIQYTKTTS